MGYIYAGSAAVLWGLVYTLDQRILEGAPPAVLLFIDSILTAICVGPILYFQKASLISIGPSPGKLWLYILVSLVLAALANLLIFTGIRILGASRASAFEIAYPLFVTCFSFFAFHKVPSLWFLVGTVMIFAGATVIMLLA